MSVAIKKETAIQVDVSGSTKIQVDISDYPKSFPEDINFQASTQSSLFAAFGRGLLKVVYWKLFF